jgi:Xaa-Pro aminopeptidase
MAVFHSNDIMPTNADGTMGFRQNSDLQYLTGIDQEESILLIFPDTQWKGHKEVLFVRETNEHLATWEGHKFTLSEAREISGIEKVYYTQQFDSVFNTLMCEANGLYVNTNEHTRAKVEVETRDARNIRMYKEKYPAHRLHRAAPLMHQLRAIKMPEELEALKQACAITRKGFLRSLAFIKPGVMEYEIEAELIHEFIRNRSNPALHTKQSTMQGRGSHSDGCSCRIRQLCLRPHPGSACKREVYPQAKSRLQCCVACDETSHTNARRGQYMG